jgi:hypothetical protein
VLNTPEVNFRSWVTFQPPDARVQGNSALDRWFIREVDEEKVKSYGKDHVMRPMKVPHLRNARELSDYGLWARDGEIGRLQGLFIDDNSWHLRYLNLKAGGWTQHYSELVPTCLVEFIAEADQRVYLCHNRNEI